MICTLIQDCIGPQGFVWKLLFFISLLWIIGLAVIQFQQFYSSFSNIMPFGLDLGLNQVVQQQLMRYQLELILTSTSILIFSFVLLAKYFKQKTKSSVYIFWEVCIFTLTIEIIQYGLYQFLLRVFDFQQPYRVNFGWFPIILLYAFNKACTNPSGNIWHINNKYTPHILLIIGLFRRQYRLAMISAWIFGFCQQFLYKSNLIKLPFKFYTCFERCLCQCIKNRQSFTTILQTETMVKSLSCFGNSQNSNSRNIYSNQYVMDQETVETQNKPSRVVGGGIGAKIDSNSAGQYNFKQHWAFKQQNRSNNKNNGIQLQEQ